MWDTNPALCGLRDHRICSQEEHRCLCHSPAGRQPPAKELSKAIIPCACSDVSQKNQFLG